MRTLAAATGAPSSSWTLPDIVVAARPEGAEGTTDGDAEEPPPLPVDGLSEGVEVEEPDGEPLAVGATEGDIEAPTGGWVPALGHPARTRRLSDPAAAVIQLNRERSIHFTPLSLPA